VGTTFLHSDWTHGLVLPALLELGQTCHSHGYLCGQKADTGSTLTVRLRRVQTQ
jgi:hypothetical protein